MRATAKTVASCAHQYYSAQSRTFTCTTLIFFVAPNSTTNHLACTCCFVQSSSYAPGLCLVAAASSINHMPGRTFATTTACQASTQSATQPALQGFIAACAKALRACPMGESAIYAGGQALLQDHGSIACLGKIAAATGATLICENAFPRIDRGNGLPHFQV